MYVSTFSHIALTSELLLTPELLWIETDVYIPLSPPSPAVTITITPGMVDSDAQGHPLRAHCTIPNCIYAGQLHARCIKSAMRRPPWCQDRPMGSRRRSFHFLCFSPSPILNCYLLSFQENHPAPKTCPATTSSPPPPTTSTPPNTTATSSTSDHSPTGTSLRKPRGTGCRRRDSGGG